MSELLKLPIGIDSFEKIRKENFFYVDKTKLIEQLLERWGEVNLFTRPRRFGKTLNMSMLYYFFSNQEDSFNLFKDLNIAKDTETMKHMNLYPVISISLKELTRKNFKLQISEFINNVVGIAEESGYELKKASVFCTPSIAAEYYHLEEIKEFDTDLIEMETASLYLMADLLEIPTVALLVVSDNSATGAALVGRTEEEQRKYDYGRNVVLPTMILKTADAKWEVQSGL